MALEPDQVEQKLLARELSTSDPCDLGRGVPALAATAALVAGCEPLAEAGHRHASGAKPGRNRRGTAP